MGHVIPGGTGFFDYNKRMRKLTHDDSDELLDFAFEN
jgi:hypothetical protein